MTLRSIKLSAAESDWRLFTIRRSDPKFKSFQERVLTRDQHTCQYCGFKSEKFMDVVNADGNYKKNSIDNLITSCPFCTQCFFLDGIGKSDFGGGILIYMPELTQNDLNALCHVLFAMIISGGQASSDAKTIYRNLRLRSQYVEKELGKGLSVPSVYGQLLIDAKIENKADLHNTLMNKMRVLPIMSQYVDQMQAWGLEALIGLG
jgi:intracellular multiplication protein IcmJ